jgi:c-di-GMP-binding flagellar brake protein YcgR
MYAINLPWEQSNDILQWAIDDHAHLRITVRLAKDWTEMPSEVLGGKLLKTLIVRRFPAPWTQKMISGQLLPCSFRKGHRKYLFVSALLDEAEIELDGQKEQAYVLAWPEGVQQVQRRLYFRAAVPSDMNLFVRIWPSVAALDNNAPANSPPLQMGRLIDISAGGCQVELGAPDALTLDKSYLLEIELPKPEPPILIQAQARRVQTLTFTSLYRYGLQFLSLDHSPRGQETLLRLARFTNYLRTLMPAENMSGEQS